jgi:hypothetical protein
MLPQGALMAVFDSRLAKRLSSIQVEYRHWFFEGTYRQVR